MQLYFRFSAYYDPGRDTIDPCRTTQFHPHFKPLHVIQAKYQSDIALEAPHTRAPQGETQQIHMVPTPSSKDFSGTDLPAGIIDELLAEFIRNELADLVTECSEESDKEAIVSELIGTILDDTVNEEAERVSEGILEGVLDKVFTMVNLETEDVVSSTKIKSNFSLFSDLTAQDSYRQYTSYVSFDFNDLVEDVVKKIMACFDGKHTQVYRDQTSTSDCNVRDGEDIITEIVVRLIGTVQEFTYPADGMTPETSAQSILESSDSSSREILKDLHKRAQFLLNHALDVAKVKLKLTGYSYLTWNILEDCLQKAKDKILFENGSRVGQFTDVELVEWVMEESKLFLKGATTVLYDMLHGSTSLESQQIVEDCYLDQLEKSELSIKSTDSIDRMLEECAQEGNIAKFAVLLVKKTINNALTSIPRTSSVMLCEALRDGNFDLAGSILAAKAVKVAYEDLIWDPQCPSDIKLRDAVSKGDAVHAGAILANRAIQQAMDIHSTDEDDIIGGISSMVLQQALQEDDLGSTGDVVIDETLKEAIDYLRSPFNESTLENALKLGDLNAAGTILAGHALEQGLLQLTQESGQVRHASSIALDRALEYGDLPAVGDILTNRAIRCGVAELKPTVVRKDSSIALENALDSGNLSGAGDIIVKRLLKSGMSEIDEDIAAEILRGSSSAVLQSSLKIGDLDTAAPILVQRALRSAQSNPEEEGVGGDEKSYKSPSDLKIDASIKEGDLYAAADILTNRALNSPTKTPSELVLELSLEKGNLDIAAPILVQRALRSAQSNPEEEGVGGDDMSYKSPSDLKMDASLKEGNLYTAADILTDRALKSPTKTVSELVLNASLEDGDLDVAADILSFRALTSPVPGINGGSTDLDLEPVREVFSDEKPTIINTVSFSDVPEYISKPLFYECVYFLEAPYQSENDENVFKRGEKSVTHILECIHARMEQIFENDSKDGYKLLNPSLQKTDYNGTAKVLTKILLDETRLVIADYFDSKKQRTKVSALVSLLVFKSCLEVLRGSPGFDIIAISNLFIDYIRNTLLEINVSSGNEAIVSIVIGKSIGLLANTKTMKVRNSSSIELFEACRAGDQFLAGEVLSHKVLKQAECILADNDIEKYRSANEIMDEKQTVKSSKLSNTSLKSSKCKKKINTDGLPMPKPLSSSAVRSASNYEPIREMLISEEREHMVNSIVSNSERMIKSRNSCLKSEAELRNVSSVDRLVNHCTKELFKREEGDVFVKQPSDQSLPLSKESSSSMGYVRKIQSKDHVYYINEGGVIKKRAKKKRSSKKRISQDDLNIQPELDSGSREPKAFTSDTDLIQLIPSSEISSDSSRKSFEHRRSSCKKKESSLQMLAVINSSYTNMVGKKPSDLLPENSSDKSNFPPVRSMSGKRRPSINDLLSDTEKELIQKLSTESIHKK